MLVCLLLRCIYTRWKYSKKAWGGVNLYQRLYHNPQRTPHQCRVVEMLAIENTPLTLVATFHCPKCWLFQKVHLLSSESAQLCLRIHIVGSPWFPSWIELPCVMLQLYPKLSSTQDLMLQVRNKWHQQIIKLLAIYKL